MSMEAPVSDGVMFPLPPGKTPMHPAALKRFPTLRRNSFLYQLHDQVQLHKETEPQRQRQKEVKEIYRILQRNPETREAHEIDTLYDWVLRNGSTNKIFQGAQEIICKTICREMTLLELPPKGVVCYQGDYGDTFYVVISGSVSLYINARPKPRILEEDNNSKPLPGDEENLKLQPEEYGTFIKHITDGGTFGELAVMDPTARRSCTITCDEPTSFICLKRGSYQRLIRITNSSQLDFTQIEFLETIYFFEGWPHGELTRLSNRLRQMHFPADSYLTRIGADANTVFFIYAGLVQETVPMIQVLNENGSVQRCAELESNLAKRRMQGHAGKRVAQQRRRTELELTLYQDHDICAEYPIFFNKSTCCTDLLAGSVIIHVVGMESKLISDVTCSKVTDVKTLVMDVSVYIFESMAVCSHISYHYQRETWKELFYMHALDHIRESFGKFRRMAEARENWRKTRVKLALANPGLILTISTKAMMQDGKCLCGWCGNQDHITGDACCPGLAASKKKQEDRQKTANAKKDKILQEITAKVQSTNDNTHAAIAWTQDPQARKQTIVPCKTSASAVPAPSHPPGAIQPTPPEVLAPRRYRSPSYKMAAQNMLSVDSNVVSTNQSEALQTVPTRKGQNHLEGDPSSVARYRKLAISDFPKLLKVSDSLYTSYQNSLETNDEQILPAIKVEDVRKGAFTEALADQYKHEMVRKAKRLSSMEQYIGIRTKTSQQLKKVEIAMNCKLPRKPKIPKPSRRLVNPKTKQLRPDRFNRKINRMMRKIWRKDNPLPVIEESLRDT
ncbi:cAMP-dependent protein kinase regulatory subunit [Phytophthora citrophthora]|uniref:cAMP-dependent protein kinase regulatory subunit n=1 Tax=Phytophthora citrophthora TaxID=4793 RepID=A0AAD9GWM6_9STRA|nr:cAMP-dependent protein kinase regulatory subunit [Phytophthora citrophthora]